MQLSYGSTSEHPKISRGKRKDYSIDFSATRWFAHWRALH